MKKQRENYPAKQLGFNHGDFHFANVIVAEDDTLFVVDWSYSNVRDIRMDIGYAFCIFNMEKQKKLGKLFLEYYEEQSGELIGEIAFYEGLAAIQLLFFCIISIEKIEKESEEYKKSLKSFRFYIENLYEFLAERTQIKIPEIEELLG
ncbi:MAG: phosphotransferase family protein [Candidatus Heimdallarchaeaceae archaeon]